MTPTSAELTPPKGSHLQGLTLLSWSYRRQRTIASTFIVWTEPVFETCGAAGADVAPRSQYSDVNPIVIIIQNDECVCCIRAACRSSRRSMEGWPGRRLPLMSSTRSCGGSDGGWDQVTKVSGIGRSTAKSPTATKGFHAYSVECVPGPESSVEPWPTHLARRGDRLF